MMNIMKNLKTSTQIALKFTIYFAIIFSILWIITNGVFFRQWSTNEYNRIKGKETIVEPLNRKWLWWRFKEIGSPVITLDYVEDIEQELKKNAITQTISQIDGMYIMYFIGENNIKIMDVSRPVEMQYTLFWITLLIIIAGTVFTFWISRRFARSSLQKINELVDYTKQLDIHNLTKKVPISWPEDDEIRIIAWSFQKSLDIIKEQTDSLKDFVSYASHELKTPLSTIRGLVDLGIKTKDSEKTWPKIKKTLTEMSDLLDSLLLITKREFSDIHKEEINIVPIIQQVEEQLKIQYKDKKISYTTQLPKQYTVSWKSDIIKIIISNLLNNAYKFTPEYGTVSIYIEKNKLIITDSGIGISKDDQEKIRKRFWKKSTENNTGYGLWLYMVKLLVEKLERSIQVKSKENQWTTFTITLIS